LFIIPAPDLKSLPNSKLIIYAGINKFNIKNPQEIWRIIFLIQVGCCEREPAGKVILNKNNYNLNVPERFVVDL